MFPSAYLKCGVGLSFASCSLVKKLLTSGNRVYLHIDLFLVGIINILVT